MTTNRPLYALVLGLALGSMWLVLRPRTDTGGQETNRPVAPSMASVKRSEPLPDVELIADSIVEDAAPRISSVSASKIDTVSRNSEHPNAIKINHVEHRVEWEGSLRRVFHLNGSLRSEGVWINGKREGEERGWYDNGALQSVANWVEGLREGQATSFARTGDLTLVGDYERGFRIGIWERYDSASGILIERKEYALGGKKDGIWEQWNSDGTTLSRGNLANGRKTGFWEYWREDGEFWKSGNYLAGKRTGYWQVIMFRGIVDESESGVYDNDKKVND